MYKFEFSLPGLPKTTNSGGRQHWAVKVKEANAWKAAVLLACIRSKPKSPLLKAQITFTRYSSNEPDWDGLVSSFKHVLDGLKFASIIKDDKMSIIGAPIYKWEKVPRKQGRISVLVEELSHEQDLRYLPLSPEK